MGIRRDEAREKRNCAVILITIMLALCVWVMWLKIAIQPYPPIAPTATLTAKPAPQAAMAADTPGVAPDSSNNQPTMDAVPLYEICRDAVARRWILYRDGHTKCFRDCLNHEGAQRGDCLDRCDAAIPSDADIGLDMCRHFKWGWPQCGPDETGAAPPSQAEPPPQP